MSMTREVPVPNPLGIWPEAPDWVLTYQNTGSVLTVTLSTLPAGTVSHNLPIDPGHYVNDDWHHLALAYDGTWKRLYKNGVEIAAWNQGYYVASNEGNFLLGSSFQGLIDEVRVWNVVRTPIQLRESMYSGLAGDEKGLVAYWRLDEGEGAVARDSALHGYTGTLNAPGWSNETAPILPVIGPPVAFTGAATNLTTNSATVFGAFNCSGLQTTAYFEYGLTTNYGNQTPSLNVSPNQSPTYISNVISSLNPAEYYHFRLTAINGAGTNYGADDSAWPAYRQNPRHTGSVEKPKLLEGHWLSDGRFEFRFYGHPGPRYAIQISTDLNNWQGLTNVTVGTQPIWVSDPTAINTPTRFYRSVAVRGNP
jgi:hypothetical protein